MKWLRGVAATVAAAVVLAILAFVWQTYENVGKIEQSLQVHIVEQQAVNDLTLYRLDKLESVNVACGSALAKTNGGELK